MSQPSEPKKKKMDDDEDEFLKLIAGIEARGDSVAESKQASVDSQQGPETSGPVDPDLALVRGCLRDLKAGRVDPAKVGLLCDHQGRKIHLN